MRPALHPAVHEYLDPITYGIDDFGQLVERCPRAVKLSAAMVGNNDAGTTDVGGVFGVGWGHDALQAELTVPVPHHLGDIVPVHRWVEHLREITADRECAAAHIDVLIELRQSEPLVSDVVDSPPRLHCKLQHPSERQPEWYGKACAKILFQDIGNLAMTVYTPEVYPVQIRGKGAALAMGWGRFGGMI